MMIAKAILFDLDNTLILYDEAAFYERYFKEVSKAFSDIIGADEFLERTFIALRGVLTANGGKTNADTFLELFTQGVKAQKKDIWERFMLFYGTVYDSLRGEIHVPDSVKEVFEYIDKSGVLVVLASNPIFPLDAHIKRLSWGGLDSLEFDLVTHIENMHFCKPNREYYMEISKRIQVDPQDCLMVGNDPLNDMAASLAGMKTFLTNDAGKTGESAFELTIQLMDINEISIPEPNFQGPLSGVISAVEGLPHEG